MKALVVFAFVSGLALVLPAIGGPADPFEDPLEAGWPQPLGSGFGGPIFADLNRDGRLEVLLPDDGWMRVYDALGNTFPGWPRFADGYAGAGGQAAVADVDADGSEEVIVAFAGYPPSVFVFDQNGNTKPGWPVHLSYQAIGGVTAPVVVDLDLDGTFEIGVAGEVGVFFFRADGSTVPGWPYLWSVYINNPQYGAPAVGDLDGDGFPEVVVGTLASPSGGVKVHVIRHDAGLAEDHGSDFCLTCAGRPRR
jgi:hypothetical protein